MADVEEIESEESMTDLEEYLQDNCASSVDEVIARLVNSVRSSSDKYLGIAQMLFEQHAGELESDVESLKLLAPEHPQISKLEDLSVACGSAAYDTSELVSEVNFNLMEFAG